MRASLFPRLRIIISAYACSPFQGSEPGVGWGFVRQLARHCDLGVIVEEEKFRADIERWLREHPNDPAAQVNFHFIAKKRNRLLRKIWPPSYYWYYRQWHKEAAALARRLHLERPFDLAHQLTMVGFREPGYLWQLNLPFIWGPIGGAGQFPWRFLPCVGMRGALHYVGYNIYNALQLRFLSRPRMAAKRAGSGLIVATSDNQKAAYRHWNVEAGILSEVGLSGQPWHLPESRAPGEPLRLIWIGQHIPGKALNIGLLALARLPNHVNWELHVMGRGPSSRRWQDLAKRLGVSRRCRFHGWVAREEALKIAASGHVALITSLRDLTSTVTVEAFELGLPVIAPAHCGFVDAITPESGILVSIDSPSVMIKAITKAVLTLENDEPLRRQLSEGALKRLSHYNWNRKGEMLLQVYNQCLAEAEAAQGVAP